MRSHPPAVPHRLLAVAAIAALAATMPCVPGIALAAEDAPEGPSYLKDRGPGVPTSMFGIYVERRSLIVYPFFEYYRDHNAEYSPQELGYGLDQDFRGEYEASEYLIFLGYGLSDRFSLELEAAAISAELEKSASDPTATPGELSESGLGDVESRINWEFLHETASRPAVFSSLEVTFPLQKDKVLIGTQDWEFKYGFGVVRGFSWGTTTLRAAVEYDGAEDEFGMGEAAVEYLKRVSRTLGAFVAVEGAQDEWELITEAQVHFSSRVLLKLNSSFGLTSKATDWAPETGILFRF